MAPLTGDIACFIKIVQGNLTGNIGTDVYNTIASGDTNFDKESKLTERTYESKKRKYDSFVFVGTEIKKVRDTFLLNQFTYASKLQLLNVD